MSPATVRVVLADDHSVVREGIRSILEGDGDVRVVAEAATGEEALAQLELHEPDVLMLDITMPGMSGLEVAAAARRTGSTARILILSMHDHLEYVAQAARIGVDGYVLKSAEPAELRRAVRAVANGESYFDPAVTRHLGAALRGQSEPADPLRDLTPREREVLVRVAAGRTSREIGEEFGISHRTVETHRERIMRKLDIRSVAGLTRFAIENRLLGS
jgi:DNA-binding NarL/FixJ family response regulator